MIALAFYIALLVVLVYVALGILGLLVLGLFKLLEVPFLIVEWLMRDKPPKLTEAQRQRLQAKVATLRH